MLILLTSKNVKKKYQKLKWTLDSFVEFSERYRVESVLKDQIATIL